jgi:hypothetical protein
MIRDRRRVRSVALTVWRAFVTVAALEDDRHARLAIAWSTTRECDLQEPSAWASEMKRTRLFFARGTGWP